MFLGGKSCRGCRVPVHEPNFMYDKIKKTKTPREGWVFRGFFFGFCGLRCVVALYGYSYYHSRSPGHTSVP